MATELSRVATAALRSAPSFRGSTLRIQLRCLRSLGSSTCDIQLPMSSIAASLQKLNLNGTSTQQKRHESSWVSPGRAARARESPLYGDDSNISKPTGPSSSTTSKSLYEPPALSDSPPSHATRRWNLFNEDTKKASTFGKMEDELGFGPDFAAGYDLLKEGELTNNQDIVVDKPQMDIRCVPRTGRTIRVGRNADLQRAFKLLELQCVRNRVAVDLNRQKFHERGGLKRKRLKGERWRKRFKRGFKAACERVTELRKQGW